MKEKITTLMLVNNFFKNFDEFQPEANTKECLLFDEYISRLMKQYAHEY